MEFYKDVWPIDPGSARVRIIGRDGLKKAVCTGINSRCGMGKRAEPLQDGCIDGAGKWIYIGILFCS